MTADTHFGCVFLGPRGPRVVPFLGPGFFRGGLGGVEVVQSAGAEGPATGGGFGTTGVGGRIWTGGGGGGSPKTSKVLIIAAASGGSRPGLPLRPVGTGRRWRTLLAPRFRGDPDGVGLPAATMLAGDEVARPRPVSVTTASSSSSMSWSSSSSSSLSGGDGPRRPAGSGPTGGPTAEPEGAAPLCPHDGMRMLTRNLEKERPTPSGGGDSSSSSLKVEISGASMSSSASGKDGGVWDRFWVAPGGLVRNPGGNRMPAGNGTFAYLNYIFTRHTLHLRQQPYGWALSPQGRAATVYSFPHPKVYRVLASTLG